MDVKLSDAEQVFVIHGVQQDFRNDGRSCGDFRPIVLETGLVDSANGSARVQCGSTDVLVGVKAEITPLTAAGVNSASRDGELTSADVLKFFVDCSANATPEFEGRGGEGIAEDLTSAFTTATAGNPTAFNPAQLSIVPKHYAWTLYVDILLLECAGNLFDLAGLAVKAALANTALPTVSVAQNERAEPVIELAEDPLDTWGLDLAGWPVFVSVHKIGTANAVDLSLEEEQVSLSTLLLAVAPPSPSSSTELDSETSPAEPMTDSSSKNRKCDVSPKILFTRQTGRGSLEPESILDMTRLGGSVGGQLHEVLDERLREIREGKLAAKDYGGDGGSGDRAGVVGFL